MSTPKPSTSSMAAAVPAFAVSRSKSLTAPIESTSDFRHGWVLQLMKNDGPGILRMLHRLLSTESDVMDAYQDCFCKLAARGGPTGLVNARAYAYRTAGNIAIEMLRSRRRHENHRPQLRLKATEANQTQTDQDSAPQEFDRLREAIAQLPPHLQSVVVLRDLGSLPYEEVGRTLGIDPATARVYRRHAIVRLARLLNAEELT